MSLPPSLRRTPSLDRWLTFVDDGTVLVFTGKAELGQGIKTAVAMIAAEELDVSIARIRVQSADTELSPNELVTAGSMSVEHSGSAVRIAAATARQLLMALAADELDVDESTLEVEDGLVSSSDSNEQTNYWSLFFAQENGPHFGVDITVVPHLKNPHAYRIVNKAKHKVQRLDLAAKVSGDASFVHDLVLPHMLHGRMVKPPVVNARLEACPDTIDLPHVQIVRDGSFLGVIARREDVAASAADALAALCIWQSAELVPLPAGVPDYLRANVTRSLPVVEGTPLDEAVPDHVPLGKARHRLQATYYRPYQMHASIGPSAAVAEFVNGKLTVYSHSQGVELLKAALAEVMQLPEDQVHVIHAEGAGSYGHNGADDAALDAALLARAAEPQPVSVKWTRDQEHRFEPYTPAALCDLQASLDKDGQVIDWVHETTSCSHLGRPRPTPGHTNLQSAAWLEHAITPAPRQPALMKEVGIHRNLEPIYTFARKRLVKHFVADSPLRTSSLRSLGAFANVFAIESFMDELAVAAKQDPFAFRLAHLGDDARARTVLETLRDTAPAASNDDNAGRGIAIARYKNQQTWCGVMVDLHVAGNGQVRLDRALIVADAGLVIDPDGITNQLEGGFIQAASWTLKEAVTWDQDGITSRDWESYPILTFSEVPVIDTLLVQRPLEPAAGAGEASTGPTPAAIANAVFAAVGVRIRNLPITAQEVQRAAAK